MARICSQCNYYNSSGEQSDCPKCQVPLQTTFLPPPGQAPAPLRNISELEPRRRRVQPINKEAFQLGQLLGFLLRNRLVCSLILAPLLGTAGVLVNNSHGSFRDRYEQIEPGMMQDEVEDLMGDTQLRFGRRTRSFSARRTSSGSIDLTWRENGASIHVFVVNGAVVNKTQEGLYAQP